MASPFRTFRKNQKVWMAVITIMAIVAFVFLSGPMLSLNRIGTREPAVVQTKFGSLTQPQIISLRDQRKLLHEFVDVLRDRLGGNQQTGGYQQAANISNAVSNILGDDTADMAIERWVYARTAESMGVVIDDKAVNDLLSQMTIGVSEPHNLIEDSLRRVPGGINQPQLFMIMREQLLAIRLMQLGHQYDDWAGNTATPGEHWDYFKRFHQRASVEVAVLRPSNYVNDSSVKEPKPEELKQFFDKYKEVEPSPDSPQPGFRLPRKVAIEYLEADPENYESQITDAEITKAYEKDPKNYARAKEDYEKQEKEERDAREKEDKAAAKAGTKTPPENKPATEPKEQTPQLMPEVQPATGPAAKPENKNDAIPAAKSTASSPTKPDVKQEAMPAAGKTPEPIKAAPGTAKPSGSSLVRPASPFRLVAYVDDKATDKATDKTPPAAPKSSADQKAVDSKQPPSESTSSAKSDAKPDSTKNDSAKKDSEKKAVEAKPADTKSSDTEVDKKDTAAKKEERKPIKTAEERLRDDIRKDLADKKYRESIAKVRKTLDAYRSEWVGAGDEKPKPPDFAVLAKKYNMTAHRTGLVSMRQLFDTEFGKSQVYSEEARGAVPAVGEIFGPPTLYKVGVSFANAPLPSKRLVYFFWKTDDQPGGVPKWDDKGVQSKVREEWKLVQAREPAMKAAEKLMKAASAKENAGKSLKSLVEAKSQIEVVQPPRFTWITSGMLTGQSPALSEVGDLQKPGEDFMKAVFGLSPGQVSVATNRSKSEVYVIRMISLTPFQSLWDQYTSEDTSPETTQEYLGVMRYGIRREVDPAWRAKVLKDADYKKVEKKPGDDKPAPQSDAPEGPPPPEEY